MKICSSCHQDKSLSDFYHEPRKADGHSSHCKQCILSRLRERRRSQWVKERVQSENTRKRVKKEATHEMLARKRRELGHDTLMQTLPRFR